VTEPRRPDDRPPPGAHAGEAGAPGHGSHGGAAGAPGHGSGPGPPDGLGALLSSRAGRIAGGAVAALLVLVLVGVAALWPRGAQAEFEGVVIGGAEQAEVVSAGGGCEGWAGEGCRLLEIRLLDGPNEGRGSFVTLGGGELAPEVTGGDTIRVARNAPFGLDEEQAAGIALDQPEEQPYAFVDFERRAPLVWLFLAFAAVVLFFGRRRGARSLVGLAVSLVVVIAFLVPAILAGRPPFLVAVIGGLAVMLTATVLTHGTGLKSAAAMLGAAASLLVTAVLALTFVKLAHITGFSSEEATLLLGDRRGDFSLEGLVLAGMVIGALGVLDDVTVSQASTVLALRRANPAQGFRQLYDGALTVGRDHLGATVNTLALAYVGAALPILLIFSDQRTGFGEAVNREPVAAEVIAMLVGSIGLVAAVPLTTALAALLATRVPASAVPGDAHAHAH
jgi:uncharacterized membrane protein